MFQFSTIEEALEDLRQGKVILCTDDPDRENEGDFICAKASGDRMKGANVYLDVVSVGATMNIMMAAALADGTTVIENAAKEPHIVDLANFLNSMGANIKGAGTDTIRIFGVDKLHGGTYAIIPDQIEAGTYMAAVAACGGQVLVRGIIPKHMDCITAKLQELSLIHISEPTRPY